MDGDCQFVDGLKSLMSDPLKKFVLGWTDAHKGWKKCFFRLKNHQMENSSSDLRRENGNLGSNVITLK